MRDVAVIGLHEPVGRALEKSHRQIWTEAALEAIADAGVDHVDALYVGACRAGCSWARSTWAPCLRSARHGADIGHARGVGLRVGRARVPAAYLAVASGEHDIVLASGVEKMTDVDGGAATYALSTAADQEYECYHASRFPGSTR